MDFGENTADSPPQSMEETGPTFGGPGFDAQHQKREKGGGGKKQRKDRELPNFPKIPMLTLLEATLFLGPQTVQFT